MVYYLYMENDLDSLLNAYKKCKNEKKKRLLHLNIVENGMEIVKKISKNTPYKSVALNFEDIFQAGTIGLLKAIDLYSTNIETNFTAFATKHIKGEIMHCIRNKSNSINAISLDTNGDYEMSMIETISDNDNYADLYDNKLLITDEIEKLPENMKSIIKMNFFDEMTQKEIAEITHSSTMHISRMVRKALNQMYKSIIGSKK